MSKQKKVQYKFLSKKGTDRLYHILFWPVFLVFSIFHPVRMMGRSNIPEGAAVIAANHSAYAVKRAIKVLKEGCKLLLFPEGTRVSSPEESTEAKTGAVMFAVRAGVPVVPVYIPRKKHWFRFTRITVGEAYYPDVPARRATPEDYQRAADELMRRIYALEETA